jgi:hypothetical protein
VVLGSHVTQVEVRTLHWLQYRRLVLSRHAPSGVLAVLSSSPCRDRRRSARQRAVDNGRCQKYGGQQTTFARHLRLHIKQGGRAGPAASVWQDMSRVVGGAPPKPSGGAINTGARYAGAVLPA